MTTPISGRYCNVKLGTTSEPVIIPNLGHWEINFGFDELDASVFGTVWKKNLVGMGGWTGTVEGFFDYSTGAYSQLMALTNAALDGTKITDIRFYAPSTSLFWMPNYTTYGTSTSADGGCYISNVRITADKNALCAISFSLTGYGEIALWQSSSATAPLVEGT